MKNEHVKKVQNLKEKKSVNIRQHLQCIKLNVINVSTNSACLMTIYCSIIYIQIH